MSAYLIADVEVTEPEAYRAYAEAFDAILALFDGRILVVGGKPEAIEGEWIPHRLVILEFPSADHAKRWHSSPEYAEIAPIRQKNAITHYLTLVEGWKST